MPSDDALARSRSALNQSETLLAKAQQRIIELTKDVAAAEQRGRAQMDSQRASEADFLNTELRQNYRQHDQVTPESDWRPAFRELVDGVLQGERFRTRGQRKSDKAEGARAERERLRGLPRYTWTRPRR